MADQLLPSNRRMGWRAGDSMIRSGEACSGVQDGRIHRKLGCCGKVLSRANVSCGKLTGGER